MKLLGEKGLALNHYPSTGKSVVLSTHVNLFDAQYLLHGLKKLD
jgi:hypothetical protein